MGATGMTLYKNKAQSQPAFPQSQSGLDGSTAPLHAATSAAESLKAKVAAIFARILVAMDKSRRRQATLVWRQYSHLIDEGYWVTGPASADHMDDFDCTNRS